MIHRIFHYWTFSLLSNHVNISLVLFTFVSGVEFLFINVSETAWDAYSYADMKRVFSRVTMHNSAYNSSIVSCEFTFRPRLACERAFFISMTSVVLSYAKHIFPVSCERLSCRTYRTICVVKRVRWMVVLTD